MDSASPKQVLQYSLLEKLGAGPSGEIYKAWDPALERHVAVKLIRPELIANRAFRAQCLSTIRALTNLSHPHIGAVYSASDLDGSLVVVTEFIEGQSLQDRIQNQAIGNHAFLNIACQVADGLNHAHQKAITHGNIKPSNIILSASGVAKLVDFGLSLHPYERTTAGPVEPELVAYRSPEHITGDKVTALSDLFSLGSVFWQALSGQPAFGGDTVRKIEDAILHERLDFHALRSATKLPGDTILLLESLLAKLPDDRIQNADKMLISLQEMRSYQLEAPSSGFVDIKLSSPRQYLMLSVLVALLIILWLVVTTVYGD